MWDICFSQPPGTRMCPNSVSLCMLPANSVLSFTCVRAFPHTGLSILDVCHGPILLCLTHFAMSHTFRSRLSTSVCWWKEGWGRRKWRREWQWLWRWHLCESSLSRCDFGMPTALSWLLLTFASFSLCALCQHSGSVSKTRRLLE